jgi:hypothetical protein
MGSDLEQTNGAKVKYIKDKLKARRWDEPRNVRCRKCHVMQVALSRAVIHWTSSPASVPNLQGCAQDI